MALNKSAIRRLSLLAGSSIAAAGLATGAFTGAALIPTSAQAYDECAAVAPTLSDGVNGVSDPSLNGATADSFNCSTTPFATGVTYTSSGALTVTKTNTTATNVTANGVNLIGVGADSVTWNSSAGGVTGGAGTAGPVIDISSVSGAISVTTGAVSGSAAGTTYGIYARSTGGGAITIARPSGAVSNNVAGGEAAIAAITNGGNINISNTTGPTTGRLRGILAQTSGAGSVTMALNGGVNVSTVDGIAALDVSTGTGGASLTLASSTITGGAGLAIRAASTGAVVVSNTGATIGTINTPGMPTGGGAVDFSGVTGGVTFNNSGATATTGRWMTAGASMFSAGADTLAMTGASANVAAAGASIGFGGGNDTFTLASFFNLGGVSNTGGALDFGGGADTFTVSGVFAPSGEVTISGLEALNLSGVIYLGAGSTREGGILWTQSDGLADDVLRLHGATFAGSGAAQVVVDVLVGAGQQVGCDTLTGAADCLDLRDSSTSGVTMLTVNNAAAAATQGGYDPVGITLVDVSGAGTSAAGHFVLDPNTVNAVVDPTYGVVIDRPGLFAYRLSYDAANQRHNLVGLPRSEVFDYVMLGGAAQSIWHMTADTVTNRQTDLRDGAEGGSVWMRATGQYSERTIETSFENLGDTFTFDNSYRLYAGSIVGGMDFVTGSAGGYDYVFGGQIGYLGSSFELKASPSTGRFSGATGGVYASLWSPQVFLDATLNANVLTLDYTSPGLGAKTNTYLNSVGGKAEGGARMALGERAFLEPLATVAYVRTSFEEISLAGGEVQPADATSLRGALGLRLGANMAGQAISASYYLTGRAWNEFEGDNSGVIHNPGADLAFGDDFSGTFGEAELGVNLFNSANTVSGFLTSGVKFKDGYNTIDLAAGVRLAW